MDTKKLRQKILDLAIHGKLVPQDPNDEPASVLLERIRAEKERLVKEGKIKKSKTSKTSDTPHYENVPFEVPSSWEWTTLQNISTIIGDGLHGTPQYDSSGDYYFINGNNLSEHKIKIKEDTKRVSENEYIKYRKPLNETSILVSINGTIGNVGTYNGERVILGKSACYFNISSLLHKVYFCYLLESDYFLKYAFKSATGSTIKNVPLKAINDFFVPLPPLAEQQRIVAEIERWFNLIDQIEQGKADLQTAIKQAKSKILDLAIHGKLVPQDPNDEPASELLKRINPKAEITCDNGQYGKIPENWCVTKLGDISNYGENENIQVEDIDSNEWVLELEDIEKDSANIIQVLKKHERCINGIRHKFTKGNILYSKLRTYLNKVLIAPKDGYCTTEVMAFNALGGMSNEYICHVLRSSYFLDYTLQCGYGVKMPRLSTTDACNGLIPLPPFAEQQRIVDAIDKAFAKLDAIMESL